MSARAKARDFHAIVKLVVEVGTKVRAASLAEAVTAAEALKVSDFIDFQGTDLQHNDSEAPVVTGVFTV